LTSVVFFGLSFMSPFGIFSLYGFTGPMSGGHLASAYIVATVAIILTAISYGKMAAIYPSSGSSYAYTQKTIHPLAGFFVGWLMLLDYFFLPMLCVLLAANYVRAVLPEFPMVPLVLAITCLITLPNILGIKFMSKVNHLLLYFQILIVFLFIVICVGVTMHRNGAAGLLVAQPFYSASLTIPAIAASAALICNTFLGFDAVTTIAEETVDPRRTIPRALLLIALIAGALFTLIAYLGYVAYPSYEFKMPESASFELAAIVGGSLFGAVFLAGCIVSSAASAIICQASAARILYAMGRDRIFPQQLFGYVDPRFRGPLFSTLVVGLSCIVAAFIDIASIASFVNFGAFTAFAAVNFCVIIHYLVIEKRTGLNAWLTYGLMPLAGLAVILALWSQLDKLAIEIGLSWLVIGLVYVAYLTRLFTRPVPTLSTGEEVELDTLVSAPIGNGAFAPSLVLDDNHQRWGNQT
jgi:amino acid transporter